MFLGLGIAGINTAVLLASSYEDCLADKARDEAEAARVKGERLAACENEPPELQAQCRTIAEQDYSDEMDFIDSVYGDCSQWC